MTRLFHACDPHGSTLIWSKIIRLGTYYNADFLAMCGDLTGKAIVPIVRVAQNEWYYAPRAKKEVIHSRDELENIKKDLENKGFYVFETTASEVEELRAKPERVDELFTNLMIDRLKTWVQMVEEKTPKHVKVMINPGNDDKMEIDNVIKESERVIYPLGKVVSIDDRHELISCEWVNTTPWNTPRECPEEELEKKLQEEFDKVNSHDNLVCNFHAPPYNTNIDIAAKLDKNLRPVTKFGAPIMIHVGSQAVRKALEKHQPLLGLHGHIHESRGFDYVGRTLVLNPGSEYSAGILPGYIVDFPKKEGEKLNFFRVEV
jgi:Icc-related predicted phosphoesterase